MPKPTRHSTLRSAALLCALVPQAFANTYIVDDDGGPGVDFTTIPPAIAAASPGDVLLVRAGNYGGFTLTKGLTILGELPMDIGTSRVESVPSGQIAVLADLRFTSRFRVESCVGTVIVQRVTAGSSTAFTILDSRDVRLWEANGAPTYSEFPAFYPADGAALVVRASRVEVVQSTMNAAWAPGEETYGEPGPAGVVADDLTSPQGQLLHLALTSVRGGNGGFACCGGGVGGSGLLTGAFFGSGGNCDVVIAGGEIRGGAGGGSQIGCPNESFPQTGGAAMRVRKSDVRYSGVALVPGTGCGGAGPVISTDDPHYVVTPGYADPTLGVSGSTSPGGVLQFQIRAQPRSKAFLNYGRTPIVQPDGFSQIAVLVDVIRGLKLGAIPVGGQIDRAFPIPSNAAVGSLLVFQAVVILPNGELRRTNSVPVIVR